MIHASRYIQSTKLLSQAESIVDLGCGTHPVAGATAAVDLYTDPEQRGEGNGETISLKMFEDRNIRFYNQRIDAQLPFKDKEFDVAHSRHVFEHLDNPAKACKEMMRVAKSGVIITPSIFAECAFGRSYHKWLVLDRGGVLFFFRKRLEEDRRFGLLPKYNENGGVANSAEANPFDLFLNYSGANKELICHSGHLMRHRLQALWNSHSPIIETIFIWNDKFDFIVVKD